MYKAFDMDGDVELFEDFNEACRHSIKNQQSQVVDTETGRVLPIHLHKVTRYISPEDMEILGPHWEEIILECIDNVIVNSRRTNACKRILDIMPKRKPMRTADIHEMYNTVYTDDPIGMPYLRLSINNLIHCGMIRSVKHGEYVK